MEVRKMLPQYKTLLVATDLHGNEGQVVRHALAHAHAWGSRFHLLHIVPQVPVAVQNDMAAVMGEDKLIAAEHEYENDMESQLRSQVQKLAAAENMAHNALASVQIHHGPVVNGILNQAEIIQPDLILLGNRGHSKWHYLFWSSVAQQIVKKSTWPLLLVPLRESRRSK
jgi:nucleotide-binding universal stress UspA family protein